MSDTEALTEQQLKIISQYPLHDTLDRLIDKLRDSYESGNPRLNDIVDLCGALLLSSPAFHLPSPDGGSHVARQLFVLVGLVRRKPVKLDVFRPLVGHVVNKSADNAIWAAVFSLVKSLDTPPPSNMAATFKGTPVKASSDRLADSETREMMERELFEEIKNCTFRNVGGFWDKFFVPARWRDEQRVMLRSMMTTHDGHRWLDFPSIANERPVWDWFRSLEERFLAGAPHRLHTIPAADQFKDRKGQMDLFFKRSTEEEESGAFAYKHVLVVGELKESNDTGGFKATLLRLARYVRGVFADQPTRRFLHGFTMCASVMEVWIFDRSGLYSSGPFDIHDEPERFARAFVGYATMDDDAMGLDAFIEREAAHRHVTLDDASGKQVSIKLQNAIVRHKAIVSRGTTCYTTENSHVAKFAWAPDKRKPEVQHLKLAQERGVRGVARMVAHRQITSIAALREGLVFPRAHPFRSEQVHFEHWPLATPSSSTSRPGEKRKLSTNAGNSDSAPAPKKPRVTQPSSRLALELNNNQSSVGSDSQGLHTPGEDKDLWENRIYSCLVVSPAGRVISEFDSVQELLTSLRDAIKAHQSLFMVGEMLHRDIATSLRTTSSSPTSTTSKACSSTLTWPKSKTATLVGRGT